MQRRGSVSVISAPVEQSSCCPGTPYHHPGRGTSSQLWGLLFLTPACPAVPALACPAVPALACPWAPSSAQSPSISHPSLMPCPAAARPPRLPGASRAGAGLGFSPVKFLCAVSHPTPGFTRRLETSPEHVWRRAASKINPRWGKITSAAPVLEHRPKIGARRDEGAINTSTAIRAGEKPHSSAAAQWHRRSDGATAELPG